MRSLLSTSIRIDMDEDLRKAVSDIKTAILNSQCQVARSANKELLSLYYGIGRYISDNTRTNVWGTGAISKISQQLVKEMPGLRGFSSSSIKRMRTFYEQWSEVLNRPLLVGDLGMEKEAIDIHTHENPSIGIVLCKSAHKSSVKPE